MTAPTPTDWTGLGVIWAIAIGIVGIAFKWINSYFADKRVERDVQTAKEKSEKESFIKQVVESIIDITMSAKLKGVDDKMGDMNTKINTLFKYREDDRKNLDRKFETVLSEIRK